MNLSKALSPLEDFLIAIKVALLPTLKAVWRNPFLLFRPTRLSRIFMTRVWLTFGRDIDEGSRADKEKVIPHAAGTVLDIGAGYGHAVNYVDVDRVKAYVALEPNEHMHSEIRARANAKGFTEADGSLTILCYGVQDVHDILDRIQPVDSIISILTVCSIPDPQSSLTALVKHILKPGGQLLFYEHVRNPSKDVAWWQWAWSPLWGLAFDGCKLDRPTHLWVKGMRDVDENGVEVDMWQEGELWGKEGEEEDSMFWHQSGRFVKRAA